MTRHAAQELGIAIVNLAAPLIAAHWLVPHKAELSSHRAFERAIGFGWRRTCALRCWKRTEPELVWFEPQSSQHLECEQLLE
jgi:hypothetical protein